MKRTQSDRQAVEKIMGVKIPEYPEGRSWDDLISLRSDLRSASKNLLGRAKKEERDLTEDEERASDIACEILQVISDEIETRTIEGRKGPRLMDEPLRINPNQRRGTMENKLFSPRKTWRDIFGREPRNVEGIENFGQAVVALHNNDYAKIQELRTLNSIVGSEGGFAVPEIWWSQVYDSGVEASVCLDRVQTYAMSSDILWLPAYDSSDHSAGPIGAIRGEWLSQTQAGTRKTPGIRAIKFEAKKLALFLSASSEILSDSSALAQSIAPMMRNSLAFTLDEAILTGSGVNMPTGILNSSATISSARASAGQISFVDLGNMVGRLLPASMERAIWLCSPSAFAILCRLTVASGGEALVTGFQYGASDMRMSILGRPLRITEKLPELGSDGDVALIDFNYYALTMRESARFERTNAAQFLNDIVDMRFIIRAAGHPLIASPFRPVSGSSMLSPFVKLAA